jgi:hypothetical protein
MWFPINPETLFQRMCIVKQSNEELQEYLQYELAPYPMSLFSEELVLVLLGDVIIMFSFFFLILKSSLFLFIMFYYVNRIYFG